MTVLVRSLAAEDLTEADRIFRTAFGTFIGLPDPASFMGDADLVHTRWRADPSAVLGAYDDGRLVGSNFATRWGSFGFVGPLTVRPDLWGRGVAKELMAATVEQFGRWSIRQIGLFTFPQSPKHIGLYQSFGFWPQWLTVLTAKAISAAGARDEGVLFSRGSDADRAAWLDECRDLTTAIASGLDVEREIRATFAEPLGDTVLVRDEHGLAGFAVCHSGKGTEAGTGSVYVKFAAARSGADAPPRFERLLSACEAFAAERGASKLTAGVNTAREPACRALLARGFRPTFTGVAMQRPNAPGHNRPDCFVLDDWR